MKRLGRTARIPGAILCRHEGGSGGVGGSETPAVCRRPTRTTPVRGGEVGWGGGTGFGLMGSCGSGFPNMWAILGSEG